MEYLKDIDKDLRSNTYYSTEKKLVFDPLVYEQR